MFEVREGFYFHSHFGGGGGASHISRCALKYRIKYTRSSFNLIRREVISCGIETCSIARENDRR